MSLSENNIKVIIYSSMHYAVSECKACLTVKIYSMMSWHKTYHGSDNRRQATLSLKHSLQPRLTPNGLENPNNKAGMSHVKGCEGIMHPHSCHASLISLSQGGGGGGVWLTQKKIMSQISEIC